MSVSLLPKALQPYSGEILDIDSHEQMPAQVWVRELGPIASDFAEMWLNNGTDSRTDRSHPNQIGYVDDVTPIEVDTIWRQKGGVAPGAVDPKRRCEVMDMMGIKRQLMFPTAGLHCFLLTHLAPEYGYGSELKRDRAQYGTELVKAYNQWGMRAAKASDRVRPVLPLVADNVPELMEKAREMLDNGIRAVWLPSGRAPGGKSPAHPDLDAFWSMMSENNIAVCLHICLDSKIFGSDVWFEGVPAFAGFKTHGEFKLDPWTMANQHTTSQNFTKTIILGGVFERHPDLRFGIVELGAGWIGPLCDMLDMWHEQDPGKVKGNAERETYRLPNKPSFYVKRNIRVSGFDFEPFAKYITQYGLEDALCFATDYPHIEGGNDPINRIYEDLKPLGEDIVKKFFVTNGKWLLPD